MNPLKTDLSSCHRNDTDFLRALAILIIINSHMDDFYPVKFLATGGMIGNSIFFMLSSLGLFLSWQKRQKCGLTSWYGHRISRIYPAVWATIILVLLPRDIYLGAISTDYFLMGIGKFFYPPFWFLQALLIYYFIVYFVLKHYSGRLVMAIAVPSMLFYALYYTYFLDLTKFSIESDFIRIIFYFLIFLWGLHLGSIKGKITFKGWRDTIFLAACVGIIYAHKFMMVQGTWPQFQMIQHIAVFPLLYFALKTANSDFVSKTVMTHPVFGKAFNYISLLTLELFIVGNSIDGFMAQLITGFPFNAVMYVAATFMIACVIYRCSLRMRRLLEEA